MAAVTGLTEVSPFKIQRNTIIWF